MPSGRRIDVLAIKDKRIGIEVELNPNDIKLALEGIEGLDELYIISNSKEKLGEIRSKLEIVPEKVKLFVVGDSYLSSAIRYQKTLELIPLRRKHRDLFALSEIILEFIKSKVGD